MSNCWQILGSIVGGVLFLAAAGLCYYIAYVPGETRDVAGSIVSFETIADNSGPTVRHTFYVRLDSGLIVAARVGPHVPVKIGRRVNLTATKMPIIGIERFRFKEFIEPPSNPNLLLHK